MNRIWKPNVTVAALIERTGRFLLVEEETDAGIRFNQPAGHLDAGESLVAACAREALEETAWHFTPTSLVGIYQWPRPRPAAGPRPEGSPPPRRKWPWAIGGPQGVAAIGIERGEQPSPSSAGRGPGEWPSENITYLRFAFTGDLGEFEAGRELDAGILRAVWMTPAEIEACRDRHRSPLILQCVQDWQAGRRFPLDLIRHYEG